MNENRTHAQSTAAFCRQAGMITVPPWLGVKAGEPQKHMGLFTRSRRRVNGTPRALSNSAFSASPRELPF